MRTSSGETDFYFRISNAISNKYTVGLTRDGKDIVKFAGSIKKKTRYPRIKS